MDKGQTDGAPSEGVYDSFYRLYKDGRDDYISYKQLPTSICLGNSGSLPVVEIQPSLQFRV
jgi:hypothetical protein